MIIIGKTVELMGGESKSAEILLKVPKSAASKNGPNREVIMESASAAGYESPQSTPVAASAAKTKFRYFVILFHGETNPLDQRSNPMSTISGVCTAYIGRLIEDRIAEPKEAVEIDLWLESPGGDAHAAYKLMLYLRAYASRVRVVVP